MFNLVIALVMGVQLVVAEVSRMAGAVMGYIITTGILLWGISVYGEGNQVTLLRIPLSQPVFLTACLVWYAFDTKEFMAARKEASAIEQVLTSPLVRDEHVVRFYQTTLDAWSGGKLSNLDKGFESAGKMQREDFIKGYPPYEGSALGKFFENFQPLEGEFLVGFGNLQTESNSGWFVLTNLRLIQRDGRDDKFKEVILADVHTYQIKGTTSMFMLKSGEEMTFEKVQMHPTDKVLSQVISQSVPQAQPLLEKPPAEDPITLSQERIVAGLCPKCGSQIAPTDQNCPSCRINLAFAREHSDQL